MVKKSRLNCLPAGVSGVVWHDVPVIDAPIMPSKLRHRLPLLCLFWLLVVAVGLSWYGAWAAVLYLVLAMGVLFSLYRHQIHVHHIAHHPKPRLQSWDNNQWQLGIHPSDDVWQGRLLTFVDAYWFLALCFDIQSPTPRKLWLIIYPDQLSDDDWQALSHRLLYTHDFYHDNAL